METVEAMKGCRDNIETAIRATLDGVQDYTADATTEPWPGTKGRPNPGVRLDGDVIEMWFGDE